MKTPFLGAYGVSRSTNVSDNQLVNLFPEIVETKDGKDVGALYPAPGLTLKATVGTGPIRGGIVWNVGGVQKLVVLSGQQVFIVNPDFTATLCSGSLIPGGTSIASVIANNTQVAIFAGLLGFLLTGTTVSPITLPFAGPVSATYQDGFGLVSQYGTNQWYQSNLFDLGTWQALNFTSSAGDPDNIVALYDIHREVWVFKRGEIEIWANAGLSGFAFQRLDGVYIETGLAAQYSLAQSGESLFWIANNSSGQAIAVEAIGYNIQPVSTQALTAIWQTYSTTADAEGFCFQQGGHRWYQVTFPSAGVSWRYDATASQLAGAPMWHQVAGFNNGQFTRHQARVGTTFAGFNVVGDYQNGNLYALDPANLTDNGAKRRWLRTWRALPKAVNLPMRFSALEIQMQTGIGVPAGTNPQCMLRWSDDGGHNWSDQMIAAAGPTGATAQRVKFNRLGSTRRNTGLDRIFELSSADTFSTAITGADLL